jgi:hypothetical protein
MARAPAAGAVRPPLRSPPPRPRPPPPPPRKLCKRENKHHHRIQSSTAREAQTATPREKNTGWNAGVATRAARAARGQPPLPPTTATTATPTQHHNRAPQGDTRRHGPPGTRWAGADHTHNPPCDSRPHNFCPRLALMAPNVWLVLVLAAAVVALCCGEADVSSSTAAVPVSERAAVAVPPTARVDTSQQLTVSGGGRRAAACLAAPPPRCHRCASPLRRCDCVRGCGGCRDHRFWRGGE